MRVVERLVTLCGETHLAGLPCALVRFAGCDLRCRWCDTADAREDGAATEEPTPEELAAWVAGTGMRLVLLTGGEPLLQQGLPALSSALIASGHDVLVETSGAHDIDVLAAPVVRSVDVKCPGSGESSRVDWHNLERLRPGDVVKMVIADREDYEFAREVIRRHGLRSPIHVMLSAAFPHLEPRRIAEWIIEDQLRDVRLNVQLHRLLWPGLEAGDPRREGKETEP